MRCGPVSGPGHPCRAQVSVYRENSPGDLRSAAGAWSGDHAPTAESVKRILPTCLALAQQADVGEGMHWLVESLRTAPENVPELRRLVRLNLAAWAGQIDP